MIESPHLAFLFALVFMRHFGALVLAALHEDAQHVAVLVYATPKILALALNRYGDLIKTPTVAVRPTLLS